MIYRDLGSNGMKVSVIGFGCWQLGGELSIANSPQSYGKINEDEAKMALKLALERGVNFFDTADIYGLGKSEFILGDELKKTAARKNVLICTKGGYVPNGMKGTITDCSYEHIIAACNRSLKHLQTDYIDVYLLHFIPPKNEINESTEALQKLKHVGKIREYGISVAHNLEMIPELTNDFPIIEGYYNMLFKKFENFENLIVNRNIGFIAASPLSRGLLSGKDYSNVNFDDADIRKKWKEGQPQYNWYAEQQLKVAKLKSLSAEWNIPLENLALAYILSSNVSTAIPGIKSRKNIDELVKSLDYVPLDKEKIEEIRKIE